MTQEIDCADWIFIVRAVIQPRSERVVQIPDFLPQFCTQIVFANIITITERYIYTVETLYFTPDDH